MQPCLQKVSAAGITFTCAGMPSGSAAVKPSLHRVLCISQPLTLNRKPTSLLARVLLQSHISRTEHSWCQPNVQFSQSTPNAISLSTVL
jgi:hypothetical protein